MTRTEFESFVTETQHRVYGYAFRMLGDRDHAADVVQESMLKLWRRHESIRVDGAMSWLLKVVHNASVDVHRRRAFEHTLFEFDADVAAAPVAAVPPDRAAGSALLRRYLERALARLSEPQRSIVILREVEGFRYDEICGALDLPLTTVKVYLHRARRKLRHALEEELARETC